MSRPQPTADRHTDAMDLRLAADILRARAKRMTFTVRVIIRFLERAADGLEKRP